MLFDGDMGELNRTSITWQCSGDINRMINLINDLLDVTKIEEQNLTISSGDRSHK